MAVEAVTAEMATMAAAAVVAATVEAVRSTASGGTAGTVNDNRPKTIDQTHLFLYEIRYPIVYIVVFIL